MRMWSAPWWKVLNLRSSWTKKTCLRWYSWIQILTAASFCSLSCWNVWFMLMWLASWLAGRLVELKLLVLFAWPAVMASPFYFSTGSSIVWLRLSEASFASNLIMCHLKSVALCAMLELGATCDGILILPLFDYCRCHLVCNLFHGWPSCSRVHVRIREQLQIYLWLQHLSQSVTQSELCSYIRNEW